MQVPIVILGPTATGKSALGMALALERGGEIVNADALQVYRGLEIGTAKPSAEDRRRVPHHLVDILDPRERFSAGEFSSLGRQAIAEIQGRGKLPIVVGGSGLYLRALLEGISPLPPADPELRRELEERLQSEGLVALYRELEQLDPTTAERLAPGDRQRVMRALEVYRASGRPLSEWIRGRPFGRERLEARRIGLTLPRSILYDRIGHRAWDMVERGWANEVEALLEHGVAAESPAFQAIGYRQMVSYIAGDMDLETAVADIIRSTRRYAKRQMTWFRRERDVRWVSASKQPDLSMV